MLAMDVPVMAPWQRLFNRWVDLRAHYLPVGGLNVDLNDWVMDMLRFLVSRITQSFQPLVPTTVPSLENRWRDLMDQYGAPWDRDLRLFVQDLWDLVREYRREDEQWSIVIAADED